MLLRDAANEEQILERAFQFFGGYKPLQATTQAYMRHAIGLQVVQSSHSCELLQVGLVNCPTA